MRILFLSTSMGMGGADQQLLSAAQVLRARGHEICIVSLTPLGPMGLEARNWAFPPSRWRCGGAFPIPAASLRLARLVARLEA